MLILSILFIRRRNANRGEIPLLAFLPNQSVNAPDVSEQTDVSLLADIRALQLFNGKCGINFGCRFCFKQVGN